MRAVVVDASVAVKWVVEEAHSDRAALLLGCDTLHAPDHWRAEAVNALWGKVLRQDLTADDAGERMELLLRAPVVGTPIAELMPRAFALSIAHSVTVYDSLYMALAERLDLSLATADRVLIRRVAGDPAAAKRMIWIGDLVF